MGKRGVRVDKTLVLILALLLSLGLIIFFSAVFGPLARGANNVSSIVLKHLVLGIGLGTFFLFIALFIDYKFWRRIAPFVFVLAVLGTVLVFIPGLGFEHGGGKRWISLGSFTFQPSEALKIATVIMAAAYFSAIKTQIADFRYSVGGLLGILAIPAILLMLQPDLGTLGVISISTVAIYLVAGARFRDFIAVTCIGLIALAIFVSFKPYAFDRITTFLNPSHAPLEEGYQIKQSLIAVGSGGLLGRGFGQSLQKFTYLPEPMGDSIFAIASEEFGFIGGVTIIGLFLALALRAYSVASRTVDSFGALLAVGIATYFTIEAFINIAGILGVAPLTGIPLTFVSQGGSAMLVSLFSAGILLNVSRRTHR